MNLGTFYSFYYSTNELCGGVGKLAWRRGTLEKKFGELDFCLCGSWEIEVFRQRLCPPLVSDV